MIKLFTFALPYTNGPLHLGHLAGSILPAQILTNYARKNSEERVYFVSGGDFFGRGNLEKANQLSLSPQEFTEKQYAQQKRTLEDLKITLDFFGRTDDPLHFETVQEAIGLMQQALQIRGRTLFLKIKENIPLIIAYLTESSNIEPPSYFPEEEKEITRQIEWGVSVKLPQSEEKYTIYVWFEALIGYLSIARKAGVPLERIEEINFSFGIDNYYFHTVLLPLIYSFIFQTRKPFLNYSVQQHLSLNKKKMSKSTGNMITLDALLEKYTPEEIKFSAANYISWRKPLSISEELFSRDVLFFRRKLLPLRDPGIARVQDEEFHGFLRRRDITGFVASIKRRARHLESREDEAGRIADALDYFF